MFVLGARVWHYWIAVVLLFPAILLVVGVVVGYLMKVVRPRYPQR
jgi:hypothetical protein